MQDVVASELARLKGYSAVKMLAGQQIQAGELELPSKDLDGVRQLMEREVQRGAGGAADGMGTDDGEKTEIEAMCQVSLNAVGLDTDIWRQ